MPRDGLLQPVTSLLLSELGEARDWRSWRCWKQETVIGGEGCDVVLSGIQPHRPVAVIERSGERFLIRARVPGAVRVDGRSVERARLTEGSRVAISSAELLVSFLGPWDESPIGGRMSLAVVHGPDEGRSWWISDDATLGRTDGCGIRLSDPNVSRRHARFVRKGSTFFVQDLGSTNGTSLDGHKVVMGLVRDGSRIRIGENLLIARVDRRPSALEKPRPWAPLLLIAVEGPEQGREWSPAEFPLVIGRGRADVRLMDRRVARTHAVIERHHDSFVIRKVTERGDLLVDQERVSMAPIFNGSLIRVGRTDLLVKLESEGPESGPDVYTVLWRTRVLARSPQRAARQAEALLRNPGSRYGKFITIHGTTGELVRVDLGRDAGELHLVATEGPDLGLHAVIDGSPATLGRAECDLTLHDEEVSRSHAVLERHGSVWLLRDLQSRNGTWLDGEPVEVSEVRDGSRISVGRTTLLVRQPEHPGDFTNVADARDEEARGFVSYLIHWICRRAAHGPLEASRRAREIQRSDRHHYVMVTNAEETERHYFLLTGLEREPEVVASRL